MWQEMIQNSDAASLFIFSWSQQLQLPAAHAAHLFTALTIRMHCLSIHTVLSPGYSLWEVVLCMLNPYHHRNAFKLPETKPLSFRATLQLSWLSHRAENTTGTTLFLFYFILFLIICMCTSMHTECKHQQRPEGGVRSPGAGVIHGCESSDRAICRNSMCS